MREALLYYLLPATLLHFLFVVAYDLLILVELTLPLEQRLSRMDPAGLLFLYLFGYLLVVGVFAWVADQQRWSSRDLRWVIQISSRRGLRLAGVPLLDLGLLLGTLLLILATARYAPFIYQMLLFLVIPLLIALSISLLTSHLLHPLDDFIAEPMTLQDYADQHKISPQALAQENGFDADDPDLMLRFGQQIKLPPR